MMMAAAAAAAAGQSPSPHEETEHPKEGSVGWFFHEFTPLVFFGVLFIFMMMLPMVFSGFLSVYALCIGAAFLGGLALTFLAPALLAAYVLFWAVLIYIAVPGAFSKLPNIATLFIASVFSLAMLIRYLNSKR